MLLKVMNEGRNVLLGQQCVQRSFSYDNEMNANFFGPGRDINYVRTCVCEFTKIMRKVGLFALLLLLSFGTFYLNFCLLENRSIFITLSHHIHLLDGLYSPSRHCHIRPIFFKSYDFLSHGNNYDNETAVNKHSRKSLRQNIFFIKNE